MLPLRCLIGIGLTLLLACQSDPGPPLTAVSGKVTLDGQSLAGATVRFIPYGDTLGHGGMAVTTDDGGYDIAGIRSNNRKGLLPGTYKVIVSRYLLPDGSLLPRDVPHQGSGARQTIPEAYTQRDTTPLDVTIGAESKSFDIKLKKR